MEVAVQATLERRIRGRLEEKDNGEKTIEVRVVRVGSAFQEMSG